MCGVTISLLPGWVRIPQLSDKNEKGADFESAPFFCLKAFRFELTRKAMRAGLWLPSSEGALARCIPLDFFDKLKGAVYSRQPLSLYYTFYFRSSSGIKLRVISSRLVRSWVNLTPAESIIFLEARVDMESAYLSER